MSKWKGVEGAGTKIGPAQTGGPRTMTDSGQTGCRGESDSDYRLNTGMIDRSAMPVDALVLSV